jgi:hypothetical protein
MNGASNELRRVELDAEIRCISIVEAIEGFPANGSDRVHIGTMAAQCNAHGTLQGGA